MASSIVSPSAMQSEKSGYEIKKPPPRCVAGSPATQRNPNPMINARVQRPALIVDRDLPRTVDGRLDARDFGRSSWGANSFMNSNLCATHALEAAADARAVIPNQE